MLGFIRRVFSARQTRSEEPKDTRVPFVYRTVAGTNLTPDLALRNSVVWACVRYLTQSVAQLPWRVLEATEDARVTTKFADLESRWLPNHPVDLLLGHEPNSEMSSFSFRETMLGWALLWGNAVAEIQRDNRGVPVALWPLHPSRVTIDREPGGGNLYYEVTSDTGPTVRLSGREVFHLHGFGDGPVGYNVAQYAAQAIGLANAQELFGAAFFGNGAQMGGFLKAPGPLSLEAARNLLDSINRKHQGPHKAHSWHILDPGWEVSQTTHNPRESQATEARQHQVEEITRWFGVPPHKVQHLLRQNFNTIEQENIAVVVDTLTPWVVRFEQEADRKLFSPLPAGIRRRLFTKMSLQALLRGDVKSQAEFWRTMIGIGVASPNEARASLGLNPIGPEGDVRVMQGQYMRLEDIAAGRGTNVQEAPNEGGQPTG